MPSSRLAIPDILARIIGAVAFLGGIFLLWSVYQNATALFSQAPQQIPTPAPTPTPAPGASPLPSNEATGVAIAIGKDLSDYVKRLLALLLMCVAGALIASLGIKAIFGPSPKDHHTPAPTKNPPPPPAPPTDPTP
ncbi:MAG: hypothetical protein QM758_17135 [Armatimonas sp.]